MSFKEITYIEITINSNSKCFQSLVKLPVLQTTLKQGNTAMDFSKTSLMKEGIKTTSVINKIFYSSFENNTNIRIMHKMTYEKITSM